jgi:HD-like signal output (HDOD) protein
MQNALLQKWKPSNDKQIMDILITASFLQETGKVIIAQEIVRLAKTSEFKAKLKESDISEVEREYVEETTASVTAAVFEHWRFEDGVIRAIRSSDDPLGAEEDMKFAAAVLNILKTLVDLIAPLSDEAIEKAKEKATKFGLALPPLEAAIKALKENIG